MKRLKPNLPLTALAAGILMASGSAFAQIEEIIVTAEFRENNVQDTPIAMTAVTGEMMDNRAQTNVFEVASQAPNVTLKPGGPARSGMMAYIRGIGQSDFVAALEPGVGIYVDDVYYAQMTSSLLDLLDLERVEVLRGPQGTLSGRNSIGGAIKLYSQKPGDSDGGGVLQVGYGSYNQVDFRGSADFELLDESLFMRVAGASKARDGYIKVLDYGCTHPNSNVRSTGAANGCLVEETGDQDYTTARVSFRWVASDDVEVNVITDYLNDSSGSSPGTLLWGDRTAIETRLNGAGNYANPTVTIPGKDGNPVYFRDHAFVASGPFRPAGDPVNDPFVSYETRSDQGSCLITDAGSPTVAPTCVEVAWKPSALPSRNTLNQWGVSAQVDWSISDTMELTSISAYREYDSWTTWDSDYSPIPVTQLDNLLTNWQVTQELRLNGTVGAVDYTVGGYYLNQNSTYQARVDLNYALIDFRHGPDPTPAETVAVFANATWHATDKLNATAGIRYSDEYKEYTHFRHNGDGTQIAFDTFLAGGVPAYPNGVNQRVSGLNGESAVFEDTLMDWRLTLDYSVNDDVLLYASASTGYKSGGVNPRPFFLVQLETFEPETLTAHELGFKSTLLDDSLRLNGAIFFNDYVDIQLGLSECAVPAFLGAPNNIGAPCALPANVGDAEIRGLELEAEYYFTDDFFVDASWSDLDFEYTKLDTVALSGNTGINKFDMISPYTPETQWSLGAQWGTDTSLGRVSARIDASFQDDIYTNPTNGPLNKIDSYTLTNARIWWASDDDEWELALEVKNLSDELYYLTKFDQANSVGQVTGTPGLPRTWRMSAKRTF